MLTKDERLDFISKIQQATQALSFLQELLNTSSNESHELGKSAFGLTKLALCQLAEKWEIPSAMAEAYQTQIALSKNRNARISELESLLSASFDYKTYEKHMQQAATQVNQIWNTHGFKKYDEMYLGQFNQIFVSLSLAPIRRTWDVALPMETESDDDLVPTSLAAPFYTHGFDFFRQEETIYLLDNDRNKRIVEDLIRQSFPQALIVDWKRQRRDNIHFVISGVDIHLNDLSFLKEEEA